MRRTLALLGLLALSLPALGQPDPPLSFATGAKPSPPAVIASAPRFRPDGKLGAPAQFARVPDKVHIWGNNRFGDCVTAEEAFAKIAANPHVFVSEAEVIDWARRNGVLNGATLVEVLDEMRDRGLLAEDGKRYQNGRRLLVEYRDRKNLADAIFKGPVKIAVSSSQIMAAVNTTGGKSGWAGVNWRRDDRTDHCVSLSGYGPADFLYAELGKKYPGVGKPASVPGDTYGYLMFTWNTIGFVSHDSLQAVCREAWVREPTTDGFPEPGPTPTPTPDPKPVAPGLAVAWYWLVVAAVAGLVVGYLSRRVRVTLAAALAGLALSAGVASAAPPPGCVMIDHGNARGSGTVVASEGGRSLVLTARHVVEKVGEKVTVTLDGTAYEGVAVQVGEPGDLGAVVVKAGLPASSLARYEPAASLPDREQYGFAGGRQRRKVGKVTSRADWSERSDLDADPGDSGAGQFVDVYGVKRLAAVTYAVDATLDPLTGQWVEVPNTCRAVRLYTVRAFLAYTAKAEGFPRLAAEAAGDCHPADIAERAAPPPVSGGT